jgi:hypothetical protein
LPAFVLVPSLQRELHAAFGFLHQELEIEGKVPAGLRLQTPLVLQRGTNSRNKALEAIDRAGEVINVSLQKSQEFQVIAGKHKTTSDSFSQEKLPA